MLSLITFPLDGRFAHTLSSRQQTLLQQSLPRYSNAILCIDEALGLLSGRLGSADMMTVVTDLDDISMEISMVTEGATFDYSQFTIIWQLTKTLVRYRTWRYINDVLLRSHLSNPAK